MQKAVNFRQICFCELYRFAVLYSTVEYTVLKSGVFFISGVDNEFSVVLESVLTGHEGWIYGVHWHPAIRKGEQIHKLLLLITKPVPEVFELLPSDWPEKCFSGQSAESPRMITPFYFVSSPGLLILTSGTFFLIFIFSFNFFYESSAS